MAINRRAERASSTIRPDPAAFRALVDQGTAPLDIVLDAYELMLCRWSANGGTSDASDIVQGRPEIDDAPTLDRLVVLRIRERMFAE